MLVSCSSWQILSRAILPGISSYYSCTTTAHTVEPTLCLFFRDQLLPGLHMMPQVGQELASLLPQTLGLLALQRHLK